jgi:predicted ATPase
MKSILLAVLLTVAGVAVAEEVKQNTVSQQQLSKRPYAAPVVDKETFDGAVVDKEVVEQPKKLNVFMLDRRPYSVKAAD